MGTAQEAAAILCQTVTQHEALSSHFALLQPRQLDGKRDQNSLVFVARKTFELSTWTDVTERVLGHLCGTFLSPGDLFVMSIRDQSGAWWLLASFHGDSNGLSSQPAMSALNEVAKAEFPSHILLVGVDANTHSVVKDFYHRFGCCHHLMSGTSCLLHSTSRHSVAAQLIDWCEAPQCLSIHLRLLSLVFSAEAAGGRAPQRWEADGVGGPDSHVYASSRAGQGSAAAHTTTCAARTFLQTQLSKATRYGDRFGRLNVNLKDYILGYQHQVRSLLSHPPSSVSLCPTV